MIMQKNTIKCTVNDLLRNTFIFLNIISIFTSLRVSSSSFYFVINMYIEKMQRWFMKNFDDLHWNWYYQFMINWNKIIITLFLFLFTIQSSSTSNLLMELINFVRIIFDWIRMKLFFIFNFLVTLETKYCIIKFLTLYFYSTIWRCSDLCGSQK